MKRNRKILIVLAVLLILAGTAVAAIALQPSARDLLVEAATLTETITDGHAIASFEFDAQGEKGSGTVEVWGKLGVGPNGEPAFRAEVLDASLGEFVGITAVTDGYTFWLYHPQQNTVLTGTSDEVAILLADYMAGKEFAPRDHDFNKEDVPQTAAEAVDKLLTYFTAERQGYVNLDGGRTIALRLIPIPAQMPAEVKAAGGYVNIWLRPEDRALVGAELAQSSAGYGKIMATTLEINQGVDEALFTFAIPDGAEVIHIADLQLPEKEAVSLDEALAAADMVLLTPTTLPENATLVDTAVMRGAVVQQYRLPGGASFTIAQGPVTDRFTPTEGESTAVTVRGVTGQLFASDSATRALLTWTEGDIQFWIGGDLTAEQAVAIANSLQ
ncbi:MAG: hypothetical protein KF770_02390 [Anaerolineae bacterium]|nr:hypothetical protein [Anaerolineae bacterium]